VSPGTHYGPSILAHSNLEVSWMDGIGRSKPKSIARLAAASSVGTTLEWYDFTGLQRNGGLGFPMLSSFIVRLR